MQPGQLFLKGLRVRGLVAAVLLIDFPDCVDVTLFARSCISVCESNFFSPLESSSSGVQIAILPQPVIVGHRYAPLGHRASWVLLRNRLEDTARLLVLE